MPVPLMGFVQLRWWVLTILVLAGFTCGRAQTATAPTIASISNSQTVTEGQAVTLSVSVNGTAPFTYQWRKDGTAISGATASSLALSPIRVADAGTYTVVVTNSVSSVTSGPMVMAVNAAVAPSFWYQPSNVTVVVGDTLNLSPGSLNGTSPLTYTWKQGTTVVSTSTSGYYSKANAQASDAGSYTVTVSNIAGSVTSNAFTVTVNQPSAPTFYYTPYDQTVTVGDSFNFSAGVSSSGTVTYQWKKDGVAIAGATSYSYSKSNAQASDAGVYTVTATNSAGSTTSSGGRLTVQAAVAPTISSVSGSQTVAVGGSFSLSVYANGSGSLSVQWKKDGVAIAGATSSYYSKTNVQLTDAGAYSATVTNSVGSVTSAAATITVTNAQPPIITYMRGSYSVRVGAYVDSISVSATGTGTLSYQWSKDGAAISGATSSYYSFGHNRYTTGDAGTYTVVVTNSQGSVTSQPCTITILPALAPTITSQPTAYAVRQGQNASMYVSATGSDPLTYQWRKDGAAITGATSYSYYLSSTASSDAGIYSVVVSNSAGSVTSANAALTVLTATAPVITAHPASASLLPGDYFWGLGVSYRSSTQVTIQWYRDGQAVSGANSSSYYISNAQPSVAGTYHAVVTNSSGSVTSRDAVISVDSNVTRPTITYVSGGQAVAGGGYTSISFATSGSGETVQWYKDGVAIPNGTSKDYSFSNFTLGAAGTYTAQVTNAVGTYTTRPIVLELLDAGAAPTIIRSPTSANVVPGYSVSFDVTTEGEQPQTYQWKKDGLVIPGATSSSYYLSSATTANAGGYTVTATNRNGNATSASATLTVQAPTLSAPVITSHPASMTITSQYGYNELNVGLLDTTGVTYQWRKDSVAISGATGFNYYVPGNAASVAGRYSVVVTNSAGSATSNDAIVAVSTAVTGPAFSTQPASQSAFYGNTVSFSAAATGSGVVTYQWRKDGSAISGATGTSYSVSNAQASDAGTYTVIATDANGTTSSQPATLTLAGGTAPTILSSPSNASVLAGYAFTLTGSATGTPLPTLQWRKDGLSIAGATNATLTIGTAQASDAGSYTLVATNPLGSATSFAATVTVVYPPPTITTQPASISVQPGGVARFSVVATAVPTPTYQWLKDGSAISGANDSSLVLTNVQASQAGRYSVVVSTGFGSVTSVQAVLTVGNPITVTAPVSRSAVVGSSVTLAAAVSSSDPLVYQWAKNGVAIPGATGTALTFASVQLSDAGTYTFGITRPDGTVVYPLTGSGALYATLTVTAPAGPVFTQQPVGGSVGLGGTFTFSVSVQSTVAFTYQWQHNGTPLPNQVASTLVLTNVQAADAGTYQAVLLAATGAVSSNLVTLTVTGSKFAGSYFGSFANGDTWALQVGADNTATFIALLKSRNQVIVAHGTITADGGFSFGLPQTVAADGAPALSASFYTGIVSGSITGGAVAGTVPGLNTSLSGQQIAGTQGVSSAYVQAVPLATGAGEVHAITAPDGSIYLVAVDAGGVRGGRGTIDASGAFAVTDPQFKYTGQVSPTTSALQGTYTPAAGAPVTIATPATTAGVERLANVATRGLSGAGARVLTAGFVINGSTAKDVLIRAVGPGLSGFGVSGILANPKLRLYQGDTAIMENDDWGLGGFAGQISDTSAKVGAFALTTGSADAALVAHLDPGAYTAQITSDGDANGVVLVEVYDASAAVAGAPRLINLSTRGYVDQGSGVLIAGIVVTGNAPKRILLRGIGPTLGTFGVTGALADPKLQLYQGATLVRENDNWSDSPDAAAITAASATVGAFALPSGSKDAALLLYLAPGAYTAQVSGAAGSNGVALVEAYEVP